ncbi:hypothetical protein LTR91_022453 [Friedmanniomyces endolithicus]|uniref:F-box domain-containing protein n=2 Tax=Dothideomycetidae TaxID=451867 RepID=A0AAN6H5Y7_9PEZI|nr:hypothetical protein LTR91_022453 [Friedmanniomyces endolithicus]
MDDEDSRSGSETPSSEEDFYGTEPPRGVQMDHPRLPGQDHMVDSVQDTLISHGQGAPAPKAKQLTSKDAFHMSGTANGTDIGDNGTSSSEMDVSASSRSSSPESRVEGLPPAGAKRKFVDAAETVKEPSNGMQGNATKKSRLSLTPSPVIQTVSPAERLPTELWQRIFLRLSPATLSRCLRVSKTFQTYLTQTKARPAAKKDQKKVRILDSSVIWTEARKNHFMNMPRPLSDHTEWSMLQLIGGSTCQFCRRPPVPAPATSPFNSGPGPDGVRIIWPFGVRACGQCWERNTLKDVEILVSPAAALRFGLAYAFRTPDLHFVPEVQRQQPGGIPSHLRVAKVYYKPHVQDLLEEHDEIQGFGDGAAAEWQKGLATKGKDKMAEAARWERWEQQLHNRTDLACVLREYDLASFPRHLEAAQGRSARVSPITHMNGTHTLPQPVHGLPPNGLVTFIQAPHQHLQQLPRPVRSAHEVEESRAARKADIERRCMELEPPLTAPVLQYIESFQAAMQITTPMNEAQWEMLRPRLLAQREPAELLEHQRATQLAALQAAIPSTASEEAFLKPAKEVYDRDYEQAQEPLRKQLGGYATELINGQWHGGQGLDRDTVTSFATRVLLHVRVRYLEDRAAGALPATGRAKRATDKQGTPTPEPFLSLDNMKWVHDNKVRIHTDQLRRELFICAGCAEERKPKWFAFEGLIQHYGAKHTTAFSRGNIVVHWQTADWPTEPPFCTNPALWTKQDRKAVDRKARDKRGTPYQGSHGSAFVPPSPDMQLSQSPMFTSSAHHPGTSNGFHYSQPGHPAQQVHQTISTGSQLNHSLQSRALSQPAVDTDTQLNQLSADAREIWDALDGVKDYMECIRIHTVLHHVVVRFRERFLVKPSLDLLTDALATNVLMRPMKNAHGLACKTCVAAQTDGSAAYQSYYARIRNVKLWNASSLISHFKIMHQPREGAGGLDWAEDMIELPETQLVSDLIRTPGMDDEKLALTAAAFPDAFPQPLPKIGLVTEALPDVGPDSGLANRLLDRLHKKQPQSKKRKGQQANGTPRNGREGSRDLPEPGEDEYDPRKPMYTSKEEHPMAKFDSDVARKTSAPSRSASGGPALNLAPETLAALSGFTGNVGPPQHTRLPDRSPSVGRAGHLTVGSVNRAANGTATQPPDISAILASLTGHLQPASNSTQSSTTGDHRAGNGPRPSHGHPYPQAHEVPISFRPSSRHSSGRYVPEATYRNSASPPRHDPHDLQATLVHNARQYQQTQHVQPGYIETPLYTQAQQLSPPRYRYLYEDEQPQPQQQQPIYSHPAPAYGDPAPIQYMPLPEQHRQYGYEQRPAPPPKPEYGRPVELIPIPVDAAHAPMQYVPHHYEQQQVQYAQRPGPGHVPMAYGQAPPPHYQPMYAAAGGRQQQVYYEPASPAGGYPTRYAAVHDESGRSSVPRG